jgi:molybdopterin/thiamine biosynthesis adenylyltransferase
MTAENGFTYLDDQVFLDRAVSSGRSVLQEVADGIRVGEMPSRYRRNSTTLRAGDQLRLAQARVALAGCGGLGGYVLEFLARAGVGTMLVFDPDIIETHNANRQLLATSGTLGRFKAHAACERASEVNPLVLVEPFTLEFSEGMFDGVDIIVDCLGGAAHRNELQALAAAEKVPLVSAGVSGWTALISTTWPDETGLAEFMNSRENSSELVQGIPAPTVGFAASLQATEVIRILTSSHPALRGTLLVADLSEMRFSSVSLNTGYSI